jgi:uncharacterized protein with HEPN domain
MRFSGRPNRSMKLDSVYLRHMRDAIAKIERYLASVDDETFTGNDMMINAVLRKLAEPGTPMDLCAA